MWAGAGAGTAGGGHCAALLQQSRSHAHLHPQQPIEPLRAHEGPQEVWREGWVRWVRNCCGWQARRGSKERHSACTRRRLFSPASCITFIMPSSCIRRGGRRGAGVRRTHFFAVLLTLAGAPCDRGGSRRPPASPRGRSWCRRGARRRSGAAERWRVGGGHGQCINRCHIMTHLHIYAFRANNRPQPPIPHPFCQPLPLSPLPAPSPPSAPAYRFMSPM